MHALDIILNFFREGGIFLYPLALIWVIGLVIALERFGFVMRVGAGNRELPKVLVIVPWKRTELGELTGRPANSLLNEVLEPVDREVFRRELRYFEALETKPET